MKIRMFEFTSEQRRRAMDLAKREVGVANVNDENLTPMAIFLMSAIAGKCVDLVIETAQDAGKVPPVPDAGDDDPMFTA